MSINVSLCSNNNSKAAGKEKEEKEIHEKAQEGTANTVGLAAEAAAQKAILWAD
jgi:hypothetical protein